MKGDYKRSMLDYCKIILLKMSFNRRLFRKEYRKSLQYLQPEEREKLRQWLKSQKATQ